MVSNNNDNGNSTPSRRTFVGASALGIAGLAGFGANLVGAQEEGNQPWAHVEHDHSGAHDASSTLGTSERPVESITVGDLHTKQSPVRNVQAYGATGDGETDDYEAIQAAFDAADSGETVYFPGGVYVSSGTITASGKSLAVNGAGMGLSDIVFTGGGDGFDLSFSSNGDPGLAAARTWTYMDQTDGIGNYFVLEGLTIISTQEESGVAVSAVWDDPPSGEFPHLIVKNVQIPGRSYDMGYWTTGLHAKHAWKSRVDNLHYGSTDRRKGTGVEFLGRCIDSVISASQVDFCNTGFFVGDSCEGVHITEATMVDVDVGVEARAGPWLVLENSHVNTVTGDEDEGPYRAVKLEGRDDVTIDGNLFYKLLPADYIGIEVDGGTSMTVTNNEFVDFHPGSADVGISIDGMDNVQATNNQFRNFSGGVGVDVADSQFVIANTNVARAAEYGVRFDANTRNSIAAFNIVELSGSEGAAVKDEGIVNMVANNMAKAILATQGGNNGAPDSMGEGDTFGQTFTVDEGATLTKVRALLATGSTDGTGVTMTLYRGSPADGDLTEVANEELRDMQDNFPQSLEFQEQSGGTYFLELSEPVETPTWWFHKGDDLADVGGSAYVNRERQSDFNFIFTAFGTR